MSAGSAFNSIAMEAGERLELPRIAYSGEEGAYAHEACLCFLPSSNPVPRASFAAALEAVKGGEVDGAILPLANSIAGEVPGVADLIQASKLFVQARFRLPVRLHLLALPETSLVDVLTIASHPMALAQCRQWISGSGLATRLEVNTAVAARKLAESGDKSLAVIASEAAARLHDLRIIARDLQDRADNATTFGLVVRTGARQR